jgi:monoamine oxidase
VDVCVVGGGLAGLTAARDVMRARRSVAVLEARDRVGGRVLATSLGGGEVVEAGGEFIGPTQNRIAALAQELGVQTFPTYNEGDYIYYRRGSRQRYSSSGPLGAIPPDPEGIPDAAAAIANLNDMASRVPLDAPWTAAEAEEWDGQTFETWKRNNTTTESGRFLLDVAIEAIFSAEPRDLSLLFVLFYIAAAGDESNPGDLNRLVTTSPGAQESRFVGGSQLIPERLARQLGRRVVLSSPARRIVQRRGRVTVQSDRINVVAQRVIVAIPPPLTAAIEFRPQLPAHRAQLIQRFPVGSVIKVNAVYDRPFWREENLAGQVVSDTGPVQVTFDNTPPDGAPGVIMGFIEASTARRLDRQSEAQRRDAVVANFATYFGEQARNPVRYIEQRWDDEIWTRGCPVCYTPPGVMLDYGHAIRRPVGRIHWAGTETSTFWNGYLDGAVRSGERVAAEVLPLVRGRRRC